MKYFVTIIMTFVLAFGVAFQLLLTPINAPNAKIIFDVLSNTYWPIFGEITLLNKINNDKCDKTDPKKHCVDELSSSVSYVLLMIYMIIASVLLVDLLIAMVR